MCRVKYYNNCLFHNVQRNFIAQTGDPTGTGKGGESIYGCVYSCWKQLRLQHDPWQPTNIQQHSQQTADSCTVAAEGSTRHMALVCGPATLQCTE